MTLGPSPSCRRLQPFFGPTFRTIALLLILTTALIFIKQLNFCYLIKPMSVSSSTYKNSKLIYSSSLKTLVRHHLQQTLTQLSFLKIPICVVNMADCMMSQDSILKILIPVKLTAVHLKVSALRKFASFSIYLRNMAHLMFLLLTLNGFASSYHYCSIQEHKCTSCLIQHYLAIDPPLSFQSAVSGSHVTCLRALDYQQSPSGGPI